MAALDLRQRQRYARHLSLAEIGEAGQERLLRSRVLIVGVGALGSPAALYLAAAGVGTIGLADHDRVRLSNLQRQVIHSIDGLNQPKVQVAAQALRRLNPELTVEAIEATVDERNALDLLARFDVVVDGTDSFRARYLLSDAAYLLGKPLVHGSIFRVEGQVTVFKPVSRAAASGGDRNVRGRRHLCGPARHHRHHRSRGDDQTRDRRRRRPGQPRPASRQPGDDIPRDPLRAQSGLSHLW